MSNTGFKSFSELYRAAFAEPDPEKQLALLSEVKKALDDWEQMLQNWAAPVAASTHAETESGAAHSLAA
jgi:hypothetical protein